MDASWKKNQCKEKLAVPGLNDKQIKALEVVLSYIDADEKIQDIRWAAYMLATFWHETAGTFQSIAEYGKGKGRKYGEPVEYDGVLRVYYGRGFVQLTHLGNFLKMGKELGLGDKLARDPDLLLRDYELSYKVSSVGMVKGLFTGKKLSDYINGDKCDYFNARRIINGISGAQLVADKAKIMEKMLRDRK